ncbi:phage tail protein [Sphingomonas sp.]|jgi:phage tail-like protein|uniref:phage tail protein n=1 Tax=Sphingomonas sp. TaxID=28214 RepID=UPI002E30F6E4|nr:phage tail protein [Sphingomonas sp.]HEX4694644.1 phage tail protein [Sphingomonas sp.]
MPQVGEIWEGYKATEFVIMIDGTESPGVTKVTGLNEGMYDTVEQPDGGGFRIHKISSSKVKFDTLVIERRVDGSPEDQRWQDWWRSTFYLSENRSLGSRVRKSGQIIKRDNGVPVLAFMFFDGWIKSSKFTDLEAGSDGFLTQTIEIEHEGLERIPAA